MNFLLVNDDGYYSSGINILKSILDKYGNTTIVAPHKQYSGASHTKSKSNTICVSKINNNIYRCEAPPIDCVRIGLNMCNNIDYVFSGINEGYNLGFDIHGSGTVCAAREACAHGVKSVALSAFDIVGYEWPSIKSIIDKILSRSVIALDFEANYFLNVNIPSVSNEDYLVCDNYKNSAHSYMLKSKSINDRMMEFERRDGYHKITTDNAKTLKYDVAAIAPNGPTIVSILPL